MNTDHNPGDRWFVHVACTYGDEDHGFATAMYLNQDQMDRLWDEEITFAQFVLWMNQSEVSPAWLQRPDPILDGR